MINEKGLSNFEIISALENNNVTAKFFSGVYTSDQLMSAKKPKLVIANTDFSWEKGSHWILFYINSNDNDKVICFDSTGNDVYDYNIFVKNFITTHGNKYEILKHNIQPENTSLCGYYCLYVAYFLCVGYKLSEIKYVPSNKIIDIVNKIFVINYDDDNL